MKWNKLSGDKKEKIRTTPRIRKITVEKTEKFSLNEIFVSYLFCAFLHPSMNARERKKSATEIKNLNLNAKNEENQKMDKAKKGKSKKRKRIMTEDGKVHTEKKNRRRNSTNTRANKVYKKKL